jgi:hypothetical protein
VERSLAAPVVLVLILCALGAGAAGLRSRADRLRPPAVETQLEIPPFPAEIIQPFSFGFSSLFADAMFLEAIQVFGGRRQNLTLAEGAPDDRRLYRLLEYATDLDPKFRGAYRFAGYALPRTTLEHRVANAIPTEYILQRGVRERPDDWQIPFVLGYVQAFHLGETQQAAENLARAARLPGAPRYLGLLANRLTAQGGDLDAAEAMARTMAEQASEEKTQADWQARLVDLRMERDIRGIEAAAKRFRDRTGRNPESLAELVRSGDLPSVPVEPHGLGQQYVIENGAVRSTAGPRPILHHPEVLGR